MERFSKNRQAILDCLRTTNIHPTAEWVYEQLKPRYPSLSLGTVYRNLCQLKEAGAICSVGVIAGQEHFDGDVAAHAHVLCMHCGRIVDLPIDGALSASMQNVGETTGFRVIAPQFVGLCPDCQ